jgi:hypothetical protein
MAMADPTRTSAFMVVVSRSTMNSEAKAVPSRYGTNSRTAVTSKASVVAIDTNGVATSPRTTP